jgi:L-ascorbate metabolism protein UlaG (beta-lactamase superfamily)
MMRIVFCVLLFGICSWATATEETAARAHYIANMGAIIERGDTMVLFDPLFRNDFDIYQPVPAEIEAALLAGSEPWAGIDAVFISHYHEDHFDPATILELLRAQTAIELFAPEQAAAAIRELVAGSDDPVLKRVHGLSLANGETSVDVELGSLLVEAIRIPHSGWPKHHSDVENLVFRVTIDSHTTVMHFGDAASADVHYAERPEHWRERHTHFAMPPYWFFLSDEGRQILEDRIGVDHAIGMHVPTEVPSDRADRPEKLRDVDLFTQPGETREISVRD